MASKMKKYVSLITSIMMLFSVFGSAAFAQEDIFIELDGEIIGSGPYYDNDCVMVPVELAAVAMGLEFTWDASENRAVVSSPDLSAVLTPKSKTMSFTADGEEMSLRLEHSTVLNADIVYCSLDGIGIIADLAGFNALSEPLNGNVVITGANSVTAVVSGIDVSFIGCAPVIADGTAMFPVRFVAEAMGLGFGWYPEQGKAVLSDGKTDIQLVPGQRVIKLSGSTFIADRDIVFNGSYMYVSGYTIKKLAESFGFEAEFTGRSLTVGSSGAFAVMINGSAVSFRNLSPQKIDGVQYIPAQAAISAMGLDYNWLSEDRVATVNQNEFGRRAVIDVDENSITAGNDAIDLDDPVFYNSGNLYVSADSLIKLGEYFGGSGSYNKYKNGIIIDLDCPYNVKIDDVMLIFPDDKPLDSTAIPLRFVAEGEGLEFFWHKDEQNAQVLSSRGGKAVRFDVDSDEISFLENGDVKNTLKADAAVTLGENRMLVSAEAIRLMNDYFGFETRVGQRLMEITTGAPRPDIQPQEIEIRVFLDGKEILFPDVKPVVRNNRTLFPVRIVAESMGMEVEWDGENGVSVKKGPDSLLLTIGSDRLTGTKDGAEAEARLDAPAEIIDDRTCIPIRAVMEFFGADVEWDGDTDTIYITSPREAQTVISSAVDSTNDFADLLGYIIDAPNGAENVEYSIANNDTARVKYSMDGVDYYFNASFNEENATVFDDEFSGGKINSATKVKGAAISVTAGNSVSGGSAARWIMDGCHFSMKTGERVSIKDFIEDIRLAAETFATVRNVNTGGALIDYSPELERADAESSKELRRLGLIMDAPEGSKYVKYAVIGGKIGEISFSFNGHDYVLRGAENGGELSGIDKDYEEGQDLYNAAYNEHSTAVTARRTLDGERTAVWKWGKYAFCLLTFDTTVSAMDFAHVSVECSENSSLSEGTALETVE